MEKLGESTVIINLIMMVLASGEGEQVGRGEQLSQTAVVCD